MNDDLPSNPSASSCSLRMRFLTAVWRLGACAIWLKVALNLTVRDRFSVASMVYYAVPAIVLAAGAALLAWVGGRLRRSRYAIRALQFLAVTAVISWLLGEFRMGTEPQRFPGSIRAVFWNVGRGRFAEWDQIADQLSRFDADVLAIAEATADEVQTVEYWRERLPSYSPLPLKDGIVLLVRGQATLHAKGKLTDRGDFRRLEVTVQGVHFDIVLADIVSDPWRSRRPPLTKLWKVMQAQTDRPTLVVGDFNTPPSSTCFDPWRGEWSRGWDSAGIGYQPTWPQPFPLLTLDHVWGNRWINFHRCAGGWSNCSDHRPVLFDFSVDRSPSSREKNSTSR